MKPLWPILLLALGVCVLPVARAQRFDADALVYSPLTSATDAPYERGINYGSLRGVPRSSVVGNPVGSDGRAPLSPFPTPNQFTGVLPLGGVVRPATPRRLVNIPGVTNYSQNALNLGVPVARDQSGKVTMVLRAAQLGGSYVSRPFSFLFGAIITPPTTDETGAVIPPSQLSNFWVPEPYTTNGHLNAPYYWSPHAQMVIANQAGRVALTWKHAFPGTTTPTNALTPGTDYVVESGNLFLLTNVTFYVSGSAAKTPRQIYWTEGVFKATGKPVLVPDERVSAVSVAYTAATFPQTVATEFQVPGATSPADGQTNATSLKELRTLWYDPTQGAILAYNIEGRVIVEMLGESLGGTVRRSLGYEIVDVIQQPAPADVPIELGEKIHAFADGTDDSALTPEPVLQLASTTDPFLYEHPSASADDLEYYAARETKNLNDVLVHWTETGVAGLQWPLIYARYQLVWPTDIAKYSQYIRPHVATEAEAALTAIPLPGNNAPAIQWQDQLDVRRGKLVDGLAYYTFLEPNYPVHRALLRFSAGDNVRFERVFSWLNDNLIANNFAGTLATNLTDIGDLADALGAPQVISQSAVVGRRISAPPGELGSTGGYLAGHIHQPSGNSFNPAAYLDPFTVGFDLANQGAIIPVNAIPGANRLEIWWFRTNSVDLNLGFEPIYWPSVIGTYTVDWPAPGSPDYSEIVLASNAGSGALESLQANGSIYVQNDPGQAGYNPNEEHALMLGGQAYALRDDLNLTGTANPAMLSGTGATYSSDPYVLLDYTGADNRPAMRTFRVLREKPADGLVFDYVVTAGGNAANSGAGRILQPPMPLPLLPPPVDYVTNGSGASMTITRVNYNTEPAANSGDLPVGWTDSQASGPYAGYARFTYKDRKENFWVMRGLHAGLPALQAGTYNPGNRQWSNALPTATAVVGVPFTNVVHTSRQTDTLKVTLLAGALPTGLSFDGVTLSGTPTEVGSSPYSLQFAVTDSGDGATVTNNLTLNVAPGGTVVAQGPLVIVSTNVFSGANVTYVDRPPFLAAPPATSNCFTMRFYYVTRADFAWPGLASVPPAGSIVPYLRPPNSTADPASRDTDALDIVYRPVWPSDPPKVAFGQTLTKAANGLPAVRGQTSVQLLYQQSIGLGIATPKPAVTLFDPTSAKSFALTTDPNSGLASLPGGVKVESFQGKIYFPNLPPHLGQRFYFDPNSGPQGSLVFQGVYKEEVLGESYLLLNVLRGSDLATVKGLCPAADAQKSQWDAAIDGLSATMVTRYENPQVPGQFIDNPDASVTRTAGQVMAVGDSQTLVDSYALSASGPGQGYVTLLVGNSANPDQTPAGEPVSLYVFRVTGSLYPGELKIVSADNPFSELVSLQHTVDLGGDFDDYLYEYKISPPVDGNPPVADASMSGYQALTSGPGLPQYTIGGSGFNSLVDNWVTMRYRPGNPSHPLYKAVPTDADWSPWTAPVQAEGWIKRVLAGINPFNQRVTDLYNNTINTDANILTAAGKRWEGDVPLNLANINNLGLIEIYETVLRRGRGLSIDAGINFGPANDALLLAAGYLNDLYMLVGNEAYADAANPTIGIGTKDSTYGDIATSLFAFKGQVPSLLEEELALLRGRDDVAQPGVTIAPVYNRLFWNYTRGIDSGEVIYALNYNILDQNTDGKVDAADAAVLFPQGHGDAYGHYLTAVKGYYSLLMNNNFDWVPRIEAVNILGKPVAVDYLDERKFATASAAVARTGRQIFDLVWRKDYVPGADLGWERFSTNSISTRQVVNGLATNYIVRHWGADQWASRTAQGALFNWVVGNTILPPVDPDPAHVGIQKIDRTTVPELQELATTLGDLQTALDNAEGRLTPLGLPDGGLAFDIDPNKVTGPDPQTHFEQIYDRARQALNNAVASFDDAKDVTRLMRSEQDSLADLQNSYDQQELAYKNSLIELYGTPYADDIGTGQTYPQGYDGPDDFHYMWVDDTTFTDPGHTMWAPNDPASYSIDIGVLPSDYDSVLGLTNFVIQAQSPEYQNPTNLHYITYNWGPHGFLDKPAKITGKRASPGKLQQAISGIIAAHDNLYVAITAYDVSDKEDLDKQVQLFNSRNLSLNAIKNIEATMISTEKTSIEDGNNRAISANDVQLVAGAAEDVAGAAIAATPSNLIFGLAAGGDVFAPARGLIYGVAIAAKNLTLAGDAIANRVYLNSDTTRQQQLLDLQNQIDNLGRTEDTKQMVVDIGAALKKVQGDFILINQGTRQLDDATRAYASLLGEGDRIKAERQVFRQRAAAVIQGFRTRDAAFRLFRNEKLERYKTLFDLASRYAYLAANAYDYETGLLNTPTGKAFVNRIVNSRALGVVKDGEPQYAGSDGGDPGLSSALAEMKADFDVLKGRLGFNNPDAYGTTVSLRQEAMRILPGTDGDQNWQDALQNGKMDNLLDDSDVKRYCLQIDPGNGLPVPGIVLTFATSINPGENLFGQPLAAGDSAFHRSAFATKLYAAGVALVGYRGMNDPVANGSAVDAGGGTSPTDPPSLDPQALAATPYVYLIPVGADTMRSPPLGDVSDIRTWNVQDVTVPMPFNIGGSDFSSKQLYQSSDSLSEPLFNIRKHQAFRPVSSTAAFSADIYGLGGSLQPSQFTNRRLIGRSVWNSQWKLVIPGDTLLNDPQEGLARFIQTVKDIKLHLVTYSYSGN